jgi:hypothetical protein
MLYPQLEREDDAVSFLETEAKLSTDEAKKRSNENAN